MNEVDQLDPAIEPLHNVLGYLTEMIRLDEPVVECLSDHQLAGGQQFVMYQHELADLPGVTRDTLDEDGPVWLAVEQLCNIDPPAPEPDLGIWIQVSDDPDQRPLVRDNVVITTDGPGKDRLIAANEARAEDCAPAIAPDASSGIWSVRLRLDERPDLAARIDRYVAGPWMAWAESERPRRRTMEIYRRLREIAELADADRSCEIVWGFGVSRWRHDGRSLDLPLLERRVEIDVIESPAAEIRIRPRLVGAGIALDAFEALSPGAAQLARDSAGRILEAIERDGELSPFVFESFEPILQIISAQLDPLGIYCPEDGLRPSLLPLLEGGENLVVSDRWAIFARPRSNGFVLRDLARLKEAIEQTSAGRCCLSDVVNVLLQGPKDDGKSAARRTLSSVIGHPIDIEEAPPAEDADHGDEFFPLPASPDQIDIVRQLERSDGLVVQGPRAADRTDAIANVVCHYLALGLRVLVVSRNGPGLAVLRERLPRAIRDLTVNLTASDKEGLRQAKAVASRLQSIVETLNPHDQVAQINRLERDIIAARQDILAIHEEAEGIAGSDLRRFAGFSDLPLLADRAALAWFEDRPTRLLTETDLLISAVDLARDARMRLGEDLKHVDDKLPAIADLPDGPTLLSLHEDLRWTAPPPSAERSELLAHHAVAALGEEGAGQLADDLEALAAAHRLTAEEPWLGPLSPLGKGEPSAEVQLIVDFARDAASQLSLRAGFLARPVEAPADAFANTELIDILDRLAAGEKVFAAFAWREKKLKPVIDSILVAGFPPSSSVDWAHARDYLTWRRDHHALNARWRSLAPEIDAPALDPESSIRGLERIAKCVDAAIVTPALAKRNITAVGPNLSMSDGEIEMLLGDAERLQALGAAVRTAASRRANRCAELARLEQLFASAGAVAASVRTDVLSRIGHDDVEPRQIEANWISIRARIQFLHDRREDFELIDNVSRTMADAGAPRLARRMRTEPANRMSGDGVLVADWAAAWNWAALMREMENRGQHRRLRDLFDQRQKLEIRLRDLFEAVVGARVHLSLAQNMSSTVRQALTVFMITLRKMAATCSGPAAGRLRRMARDTLETCQEGIPCWIMPTWRVAEQIPARLGAFDLVVIDEASQSDLREFATMLRGRKVLVADETRDADANVTDIDSVNIEQIEHDLLGDIPKAMRQFLQPGTSLCDLVKVMFPDRMITLREPSHGVDPALRPVTNQPVCTPEASGVAGDEADPPGTGVGAPGERRTAPPMLAMREADAIEDEIAKFADQLALARRTRDDRLQTVVAPIDGLPKRISKTAHARAVLRQELAGIDEPPQFLTRSTSEPDVLPAPRRSSGQRRLFVVGAALATTLAASVFWQLVPSGTAASRSVAPATVIGDAIDHDGSATSGGVSGAPAAQVVLYQEDPADLHGARHTGSVTWRTEQETPSGAGRASAVSVKCDIEIEGRMSVTMSLRRNTDEALPASHVIDVRFNLRDDDPRGAISNLKGITMKAAESQRGAPLAGQVAKVTPRYFMVALSALDQDMKRNIQLLKEKTWFDIPLVYDSGSRAILAIEKGSPGERAFKDAFGAWGQ